MISATDSTKTCSCSILLGLAGLFFALPACQQVPEQSDKQVDFSTDASADISDASDSREDGSGDVAPNDALDPAPDGGSDAVPLTFDASLWQHDNSCQGEETYPPPNDTFSMPIRESTLDPVKTRADVIQDLGGDLPVQGFGLLVDPALKPDDPKVFASYSKPTTDVKIYLYAINNYEDLSSFRLNLTVMVDYAPVEARYVRWNPDRTQKWSDTKRTGINFPLRSDVEIIDIMLPGELFSERRMHEIAIFVDSTTTERRSWAQARRFALYNGGFDRPSHPCAEARLSADAVEIERFIFPKAMADDFGALFFDGITADDLRQTVEVTPGETKRFYLTVFRDDFHEGPNPTVLVPFLNGEPFGPTWWVTQGEDDASSDWDTIDARKSFEVTFPEEPGIYEVEVASWEDPYRLYRNRNGTLVQGVSDGGGPTEGSNALRFRVVEPDSQ